MVTPVARGNNPVPLTEDMPVGGCANPYGWTKYFIEDVCEPIKPAPPVNRIVIKIPPFHCFFIIPRPALSVKKKGGAEYHAAMYAKVSDFVKNGLAFCKIT